MRKVCMEQVYELAKKDKRVLFFGSDVGVGTLDNFRKEMPERFFMEGVSEANIIGMISGLAMNGKIPYFNTIGVFLTRRCYEQIMLDAAMHKLKIRLIGSGGGLVYAPLGCTHLSFQDIAIMRAIPNMTILAPCDAPEMKRLMDQTLDYDGPIYIRVAKGGDPVVSSPDKPCVIGKAVSMREGKDVLIATTGITLKLGLDAAQNLESQGISAAVMHFHTLKPIDQSGLIQAASKVKAIISVEEHSEIGGLGSAIGELIALANFAQAKKFGRIALPDEFPKQYGSQQSLMNLYGVTTDNIVQTALKLLK